MFEMKKIGKLEQVSKMSHAKGWETILQVKAAEWKIKWRAMAEDRGFHPSVLKFRIVSPNPPRPEVTHQVRSPDSIKLAIFGFPNSIWKTLVLQWRRNDDEQLEISERRAKRWFFVFYENRITFQMFWYTGDFGLQFFLYQFNQQYEMNQKIAPIFHGWVLLLFLYI